MEFPVAILAKLVVRMCVPLVAGKREHVKYLVTLSQVNAQFYMVETKPVTNSATFLVIGVKMHQEKTSLTNLLYYK